jgi:transcriptional regulator with XRE-family HTH domain
LRTRENRYLGTVDAQVVQRTLTSIAANVRRIRERRDLTQERIAELAELEPRTIQHIETGKANPTIALVVTIANALGVSTSALLRPAKLARRPVGRPRQRRASRR